MHRASPERHVSQDTQMDMPLPLYLSPLTVQG